MRNYKRLLLPLALASLLMTVPACSKVEVKAEEKTVTETSELSESFVVNYEQIIKGVVVVGNYTKNLYNKLALSSFGTGFIFKEDENYYYLLTNKHVVKGAEAVKITLWNKQVKQVTMMGTAATLDFAVLRIEKEDYPEAYVLPLADTSLFANPEVGEDIWAIGTPYSESLKYSLCKGVVSGVNRVVSSVSLPLSSQSHAIQIDATINSGNSGGPLLNGNGEVEGLNTLGIVSKVIKVQTLKFALPIHDAYLAANKIIDSYIDSDLLTKEGTFYPAELSTGNTYTSMLYVDYRTRQKYQTPVNKGVMVDSQSTDSVLGINDHSIIVGLAGYNVNDVVELRRILYAQEPETSVELKYYEYNSSGYSELQTKNITLIKYSE